MNSKFWIRSKTYSTYQLRDIYKYKLTKCPESFRCETKSDQKLKIPFGNKIQGDVRNWF